MADKRASLMNEIVDTFALVLRASGLQAAQRWISDCGFRSPIQPRAMVSTTPHLQWLRRWCIKMMKQQTICRFAIRSGVAAVPTYLLIVAVFEIIWKLPLDTTEQWMSAFYLCVIIVLAAIFWSVSAYRMILPVCGWLAAGTLFTTAWLVVA